MRRNLALRRQRGRVNIFALVAGGLGALLLFGALALSWQPLKMQWRGQRVAGEVIEMRQTGGYVAPVVRYADPSGAAHEVIGNGASAPEFVVGDKIEIWLLPDQPGEALIADFAQMWIGPIMLGGFGLLWLGAAWLAQALDRGADVARLGATVFSVIAAGGLITLALSGWPALRLYAQGSRAQGTVTELTETWTSNGRRGGSRFLTPHVRFTSAAGQSVEILGHAVSDPEFAVGDTVPVVYFPGKEREARIEHWSELWMLPLVGGVITAAFGLPALGTFMFSRARNSARRRPGRAHG
ncbi:MAG: DUF3592 domain-containing protein [Rhodocyclaceae bacterium]|nr:DUF3592 domain-containing protein [Rhodocyclaceae bacterium]